MIDLAADRARRGWTLAQMADYLGVPLGTYLNWERGRRKPPPIVARLALAPGTKEPRYGHLLSGDAALQQQESAFGSVSAGMRGARSSVRSVTPPPGCPAP